MGYQGVCIEKRGYQFFVGSCSPDLQNLRLQKVAGRTHLNARRPGRELTSTHRAKAMPCRAWSLSLDLLKDRGLAGQKLGWEFGFLSDFLNEMQGRMSWLEAPEYGF